MLSGGDLGVFWPQAVIEPDEDSEPPCQFSACSGSLLTTLRVMQGEYSACGSPTGFPCGPFGEFLVLSFQTFKLLNPFPPFGA